MDRFLETAGLASVGGWLRRRRKKDAEFEPGAPCANCTTPLQGPWCYNCGQSGEDFHRSVWKLIMDAVEGFFHADGRLWRTLPDLTLKPGRLTRNYLDGHRAPQIPPFRMFLVILLIVFFAGHLATSKDAKQAAAHGEPGKPAATAMTDAQAQKEIAEARAKIARELGPAAAERFDRMSKTGKVVRNPDGTVAITGGLQTVEPEVLDFDGDPKGDNAFERWLKPRVEAIQKNPEQFGLILEIWAHRVAILALPVSALLMSLIYVFQRRFWVFDHMVFSMHSLSFQLLLLSTIFLLSMVVGGAAWWLVLLAPLHLYKHMRGTYGSSRFGTVLRMVVLFAGTVISFGMLALLWLYLGANAMTGH